MVRDRSDKPTYCDNEMKKFRLRSTKIRVPKLKLCLVSWKPLNDAFIAKSFCCLELGIHITMKDIDISHDKRVFYQKWLLILIPSLVSTHTAHNGMAYTQHTRTHTCKPTYTVRFLVRINHKTTSRVMPIKETSPGFVMTMTASGLSHLILVFPICQRGY